MPRIPLPAAGAVKIVMKGLEIRIARPHVPVLPCGIATKLLQKTDGVGIPRGDVEIRRTIEVIEIEGPAHEIVDDRTAGGEFAQEGGLSTVERHHLLGSVSAEIQNMRWIGFRDGEIGQFDLVKLRHFH